jgi:tRNA U34 5-methylaminomethyl-2-thiouridine-forming methyltransferase MnmC
VSNKKRPVRSLEFKVTGDGSHTLYVPELNEHYHSVFGAVAESRHIFLEAGFKHVGRTGGSLNILEIGFGTGLNALLTCIEAKLSGCYVDYSTIEIYPLKVEVYSRLNFAEIIKSPDVTETFNLIHDLPWDIKIPIRDDFSLLKLNISLENYSPEKEVFDLVYFDAFGPDVQPEMWGKEVFDKMAFGLKPGGVLVTYSTKGIVKRNIKDAGFTIEKLPGPPGKREILRAIRK